MSNNPYEYNKELNESFKYKFNKKNSNYYYIIYIILLSFVGIWFIYIYK